jgi:hypothetical protein
VLTSASPREAAAIVAERSKLLPANRAVRWNRTAENSSESSSSSVLVAANVKKSSISIC